MTIRKRLATLEARSVDDGLSLALRAWLGQELTPADRATAEREAMVPVTPDWSCISKEGREWLQA
jgi:hypothetical protein